MSRTLFLVGVIALSSVAPGPAARAGQDDPVPAQIEFFEGKVRPVLEANCIGCHGQEKQKAGLRLDSRDAILRGGDSGPAVRPGDPEQSRLIEAIRYDADVQMPPKRKLADAEIAALSDWVKAGALWPEANQPTRPASPARGLVITAEDRAFWSFRPIADPTPPGVSDESWPISTIDRFILARLEREGLRPVAPADRRTLIRRATFDLTGLPPTPEEVEAFVKDESPEAFARVVDRLLASPRYGERWARHWLDVARYGEDQAHTFEARLYPFGYRYRDWVVKAFNDDMPFDRFAVEQIAGDLIEGPGRDDRLAATGFFALGPAYYGKAVFDELDDRVDTLTRGFLGLTVACARCHDHKFDPIGQKDYYALAGIFANTQYKEYPQAPPEVVARYEQAQADIKAKTDEVAKFLRDEGKRWSERSAADGTAKYMVAAWTLINRRKGESKPSTADFAKAEGLDTFLLDRWVKYLSGDPKDAPPYLARWHKLVAGQSATSDLSNDESARAEVAKVAEAFQAYVRATIRLRDAIQEQVAAAKAVEGEAGKLPVASLSSDGPESRLLRDLLADNGLFALPRNEVEKHLADDAKTALKGLRADLDRLKNEAPKKYPVVHALADGSSPKNMQVHLRGNPAALGEEAPRRFLAVVSAEDAPSFTQGSGRLELARAIASPDSPLTARVLVNRVWAQHFGRGLVATPSNFGKLGERPSHPELLDWLARRFIASGWSLKALHRTIMLSATYALASDFDSRDDEVDPGNVLHWRSNRRRLEVEAWRDAALAVSGELDGTIGGPSMDLKSAENRRRTLYAAVSRHNLDGLLRLFDFPDPNITSDRRVVTTVPLQQLFVLNSPFMEGRAKTLAARLTADPAEPDADRIRRAFPLLFGRPATDRDVEMGLAFLQARDEAPADGGAAPPSRWERYAQVLLGTNEFTFVD